MAENNNNKKHEFVVQEDTVLGDQCSNYAHI